jgi:uncharacterized protein YjbI with pentapeptide repeats
MSDKPQRPMSNDDREGWKVYWAMQGLPWRTEPEIDEERQRYLAERRKVTPDIEQDIYPFKDIKLDRADVEWLLATHESRGTGGPVWWEEEQDKPAEQWRDGLDLRGADLRETDLSGLPLARLRGGLATSELPLAYPVRAELELPELYMGTNYAVSAAVRLGGANLMQAHLERAVLNFVPLTGAFCREAHLEGASLVLANLEDVLIGLAHLEGARLMGANLAATAFSSAIGAHFEHADLRYTNLSNRVFVEAHLDEADLRGASFTDNSILNGAWLGSELDGVTRLADVKWRGTNLAQVRWVGMVGRRRRAPTSPRGRRMQSASALIESQRTLRATQQLAVVLRSQGLSDHANVLSYQAQAFQRRVARLQHRPLRAFGSLLLDLISGYGYRPLRSVVTYVLVTVAFAGLHLLNAQFAAPHLRWDEALVLSISSFHGRGFFTTNIHLGDTLARLASGEAIIGLLIEITFIATFTQRFFAR